MLTGEEKAKQFDKPGTYVVEIKHDCSNSPIFYCNGGENFVASLDGSPLKSYYSTANLSAEQCSGNVTVTLEITSGSGKCGLQ